jgi:hypothetical protein
MNVLLGLCETGLRELFAAQREAIERLGIEAPAPATA